METNERSSANTFMSFTINTYGDNILRR